MIDVGVAGIMQASFLPHLMSLHLAGISNAKTQAKRCGYQGEHIHHQNIYADTHTHTHTSIHIQTSIHTLTLIHELIHTCMHPSAYHHQTHSPPSPCTVRTLLTGPNLSSSWPRQAGPFPATINMHPHALATATMAGAEEVFLCKTNTGKDEKNADEVRIFSKLRRMDQMNPRLICSQPDLAGYLTLPGWRQVASSQANSCRNYVWRCLAHVLVVYVGAFALHNLDHARGLTCIDIKAVGRKLQ
jgi:hypothetical protein